MTQVPYAPRMMGLSRSGSAVAVLSILLLAVVTAGGKVDCGFEALCKRFKAGYENRL